MNIIFYPIINTLILFVWTYPLVSFIALLFNNLNFFIHILTSQIMFHLNIKAFHLCSNQPLEKIEFTSFLDFD